MHHPTDRIIHTKAFVTQVVVHWLEREIAQWIHPMKDRSDDPSHHERTLLPRSYISLPNIVMQARSLLLGACSYMEYSRTHCLYVCTFVYSLAVFNCMESSRMFWNMNLNI